MNWKKYKEEKPPEGEEVLAYHPSWIDEVRIRGKEEIIPLKDKREILSVKAHLCSVFSEFVKIGDWYLKMSEVKEYKPVTAEDMNPYILFKTSKFGNIKVRFPKDEDMNAELLVLDQLFDVE